MSENKALAVRQITPDTWNMIEAIAPAMWQSRLFGVASKEQAMAIALKGFELGLGIAASYEFIQVIQGKPTLSPRGALALIHRCGELAGLRITDKPDACTVWMKRTNNFEYELTFTMEDARKAGLVKAGGAWESYGPNMLRWRAVGFVADVVFPDVIGGLKRADEMGAAVDSRGNVVEGEWQAMQPTTAPTMDGTSAGPLPPTPTATLDELVEKYGADAVLAAANGRIPGTVEEVASIGAALAGQNGS